MHQTTNEWREAAKLAQSWPEFVERVSPCAYQSQVEFDEAPILERVMTALESLRYAARLPAFPD